MSWKIKNRIGIRYSRLVVIEFAYQDWRGDAYWLCKCDCGNEIIVLGNSLQRRNTKSCGCLRKESASKKAKNQIDINNPNYKNGEHCGIHLKEILELKEKRRKKDNYTCQECGILQGECLIKYDRILDIHHIDGDNTNNVLENMITLCISCHSKKKGGKQNAFEFKKLNL